MASALKNVDGAILIRTGNVTSIATLKDVPELATEIIMICTSETERSCFNAVLINQRTCTVCCPNSFFSFDLKTGFFS